MTRYKEYNWTFDDLIARIDNARQISIKAGAFLKASTYGAISDALKLVNDAGATRALIDSVNDYNELSDAVAVYLAQSKRTGKRERDLVLETLAAAALRRFDDIARIIFVYSRHYFMDDELDALRDALGLNYNATEGSAAKC